MWQIITSRVAQKATCQLIANTGRVSKFFHIAVDLQQDPTTHSDVAWLSGSEYCNIYKVV